MADAAFPALDIELRVGTQPQARLRVPRPRRPRREQEDEPSQPPRSNSPPRLSGNLRQLGGVGPFVPPPPAGSQKVVVAGNIVSGPKMPTMGTPQRPLLQYLQEQKGREGTNAVLFGRDGQPVDTARFLRDMPQDPRQFRLSLSLPEERPFFPMRPYIEAFMRQVERDLRLPGQQRRLLDWVAAVHYDTAHRHAHVILRGRDRRGQELLILNPYLSHGLRHQAAHIATWLYGPDRSYQRAKTRTQEHSMPTLTRVQQLVITALVARGFREKTFGDIEVFPGRTPQDAGHRRTLKTLVRAGVLEQPDPLRHQFRFRTPDQGQTPVQHWHQAPKGRGQEMGR